MKKREELVNRFPTSLAKYEASLVATTIENKQVDPVEVLYERIDGHPDETVEEIAERLAFDQTEELEMLLDARDHLFSSRTLDRERLAEWLTDTFEYDIVRTRELAEDTNPLFLVLFYHSYDPSTVGLTDHFEKARAAAYEVGDKRDRMTTLDYEVDQDEISDQIEEFKQNLSLGSSAPLRCTTHNPPHRDEITILLQEEKGRYLRRQFEFRSTSGDTNGMPTLDYVEKYPIHENAVRIRVEDGKTEVKTRQAVSTWEDTLGQLFTQLFQRNLVDDLEKTASAAAKEIVANAKEQSVEDTESDSATASLPDAITQGVTEAAAAAEIDSEDADISTEFMNKRLNEMTVTGVEVDGEETTFEIHSAEGINKLLIEFEGLSESLSQAVANAALDDMIVYAKLPGADEMDEVVFESGEWYMNNRNASKSNIELLEEVL